MLPHFIFETYRSYGFNVSISAFVNMGSLIRASCASLQRSSCPIFVDMQADVVLNRKVLSELAVHEPRTFQALSNFAKSRMDEASQGLKALTMN